MANALLILLGLLAELSLQSQGISLRRGAGDSYSDHVGADEDPSLVGLDCRDPAIGDKCYNAVKWSLERGVRDHPEWYPAFHGQGLTEENFREMQLILHNDGKAGCAKPCPPFFTPYATLGSVKEPVAVEPPHRNIGEPEETSKSEDEELKKEMDDPLAPHDDISDMSLDSFNQLLNDAKWRDAVAATITTTPPEETTAVAEQALPENSSDAPAEEAQPDAAAAAAAEPEPEATPQEKIDTLKAELEALESMESSPPIDAMRQEKRQQLQQLQAALPAEEAPAVLEEAAAGASAPEPAAEAEACHTAVEGEDCYEEVTYSRQTGVLKHPDRYGGLTVDSPFEAFQRHVHALSKVCPAPCEPAGDSSAQPAATEPQSAVADAAPAEEQSPAEAAASEDPQSPAAAEQAPAAEQGAAAPAAGEQGCHTAVQGDACYDEVMYSKQTGVVKHPDKYVGLSPDSPFEDFQRHVHSVSSVCPEPCRPAGPAGPVGAAPEHAASTDSQSAAAAPASEQPKGIKGWFSRFRRGAKKEQAAADEPAEEEARKFGAVGREEQRRAAESAEAELMAEVSKKEAEMLASEAQARVNRLEEEAMMEAQVARQQAKEEAELEEARRDMMYEKAEAEAHKAQDETA